MLIKFVIQAILTYTMSYMKLPKGLIKELEILIRIVWWGIVEIVERCIGLNGIKFVRLRKWEAWVSRKLKNSMTLCLPNKCGVRSIIQTPSAIGCSKIDFFSEKFNP